MLGSFILPLGRLREFEEELSGFDHEKTMNVNLLIATAVEDFEMVAQLVKEIGNSRFRVTALETKVASVGEITILKLIKGLDIPIFVEVPLAEDVPSLLSEIAHMGLSAKIRTGGIIRDSFPSSHVVLQFLSACVKLKLSFKATAGLHHSVNGIYPLTYAPNCESAPMHGHLNLMLATAALAQFPESNEARMILQESDKTAFRFSDDGVRWKDLFLPIEILDKTRKELFQSFGSCSFTEPAYELSQLL
jgi:hypothetical protein